MLTSLHEYQSSFDPISDRIRQLIRQRILDGTYKAGQRLLETDLAKEFRVSRTPIRDALRRLDGEGLVEIIPRKGVVVTGMSPDEVLDMFELRMVLETLAVRRACQRITPDMVRTLQEILDQMDRARRDNLEDELSNLHIQFHQMIHQAAGSPRLYDMLSSLTDAIRRFSKNTYRVSGRDQQAMLEHRQILKAIVDKDEERAAELTRQHIAAAKSAYLRLVGDAVDRQAAE
ncbi:MAG: GntR family transcriptional regulator [Alicyclobacillaceae bacterium]|nr:GntR family transcriptional regulator [Alicyclobacillaceae bacterium]